MKILVAAVAVTAMLGSGGAYAQTALDHQVQKTWDNLFNPGPPGDPRTNWERRRDAERYREEAWRRERWDRQRAEHEDWCRYHPGAEGCGRPYGHGGPPGYYGR